MSSQYEEDKIIADFFGDYLGTFLDLGAGDGQLCSNTEELVKRGWSGVCVEPHAESFSSLRQLYKGHPRVQLVNAAVSCDARLLKFFHHYEQLSTGNQDLATSDECYWVASLTPSDVSKLSKRFDFVSIDCEGMDQEIAESGGVLFRTTSLLCYEHDLPCSAPDSSYDHKWKVILDYLDFTRAVGKTKGNTLVTRP
jgi:FkbM family methyltransferase